MEEADKSVEEDVWEVSKMQEFALFEAICLMDVSTSGRESRELNVPTKAAWKEGEGRSGK
jgi:hypothetical protein